MIEKEYRDIKKVNSLEQGFSLIELLVVIAIIGLLAGVVALNVQSARIKGRDAKRVGDIRQMVTSMEQYFIQHGKYPTGTASVVSAGSGVLLSNSTSMDTADEPFVPNYVPFLPSAPQPADGSCTNASGAGNNNYWYQVEDDGSTYTITFCLGRGFENLGSGTHTVTPNGMN